MLERESHGRKLREVWSSPTRSTVDTAIFLIKMSRQWKLCLASPHEWSAPSVQQQRVAQGCIISCVKSGLKISSECLFWTWLYPSHQRNWHQWLGEVLINYHKPATLLQCCDKATVTWWWPLATRSCPQFPKLFVKCSNAVLYHTEGSYVLSAIVNF